MAPPGALLDDDFWRDDTHPAVRPTKKARLDIPSQGQASQSSSEPTIARRHPLGIRPSGNAYLSDINLKKACGSFAILPDEILAVVLEYLDAATLLRLGATCRALHAFTRSEDLWKAFFTESVYP